MSAGVAAANSPVEHHQSFAGFVAGHAQQVGLGGVQILRVARVGDPDRLAFAEHSGEPIDLAQQVAQALVVVGLSKDELLLPAAVVARGDGNGLAVAGLHKLELAHVDGFADGVVDEGFRVGLLHCGHDLGEGEGDGGGDFGVEIMRAAVGQMNFAVDNVGVGAGGGACERASGNL